MKYSSALVTQGSGSVGGMTASRNKGGNYMRARAIPTNPNTARQSEVREGFGMLSNLWAALTQAQRDAWAAYAANVARVNTLGAAINLTGLNMFIRCNAPRVQSGLDVVSDGPTTFNLGMTPMLTRFVIQVGGVTPTADISFEPGDYAADDTMLVYLSKPLSPTINYFKGPYRWVIGTPANNPPAEVTPDLYPFPYAIGQKVQARAQVSYADGRLTQFAVISNLVVIGT